MKTRLALAAVGVAALAAACLPPAPPPPTPTVDAPVLTATYSWEDGTVQEPSVLPVGGRYRMWYRAAGWEGLGCRMGTATSADGVHWTKNPTPVLGAGYGGEPAQTCYLNVVTIGGMFLAFYGPNDGTGTLHYATSADGVSWAAQGVALAPDVGEVVIANTAVWVEGTTWHLLYEALNPDGRWRTSRAVGTGPAAWEKSGVQLANLAANGLSTYGGPEVQIAAGGGYYLYLHRSTTNTNLPTDIYRSYSADLATWGAPVLVVAHAGADWQYDQVADPTIIGQRLWFDGDNNSRAYAAIGMVTL